MQHRLVAVKEFTQGELGCQQAVLELFILVYKDVLAVVRC